MHHGSGARANSGIVIVFLALVGAGVATLLPAQTLTYFNLPTQGSRPGGITVGPDGALWFNEIAAPKIGRIELTVVDRDTGAIKTYENPLGTPFQPIQDTGAFSSCPAAGLATLP